MKYTLLICTLWLGLIEGATAQNALKTAFVEGIKATVKVVEYEKKQSLEAIPKGYCAVVTGKTASLALWEQVKLESLAMFLEYNPAFLSIESSNGMQKNILCLLTSESQAQARESLNQFKLKYPKLENYLTKIEVLPAEGIYRVIPGVGYTKKLNDIAEASTHIPEMVQQESEVMFESSTLKVIASEVPRVHFLMHTTSQGAY